MWGSYTSAQKKHTTMSGLSGIQVQHLLHVGTCIFLHTAIHNCMFQHAHLPTPLSHCWPRACTAITIHIVFCRWAPLDLKGIPSGRAYTTQSEPMGDTAAQCHQHSPESPHPKPQPCLSIPLGKVAHLMPLYASLALLSLQNTSPVSKEQQNTKYRV